MTNRAGSAAFPQPAPKIIGSDGFNNPLYEQSNSGMTLRQYYAAHAPEPPKWWGGGEINLSNIIAWRFTYADCMIQFEESEK